MNKTDDYKVRTALDRIDLAIKRLNGHEVAEVAAALGGIAMIRIVDKDGHKEAAQEMSSLSSHFSSFHLDCLRNAVKNGEDVL